MTRPKLVAFDLDDTLIGSDGKIAPANFCALEQLSAAGVTAAAVTGRTFYEMPAELRFNPLVPCTDLEVLLSGDEKTEMFNIFFHLDDERRAFIDRATELFPELICTYSMQSNLEILRRGVDKGSALQKLAEHLGLAPEQVIAVGDSRNDLSMIRYAGTGLAVANACDELKQAANAVACTSDAGVLSYIYHHFVE